MKCGSGQATSRPRWGMTLVEVMVGLVLSSTLLAMAYSLWLFGSRSFAAMSNYTDLDAKSPQCTRSNVPGRPPGDAGGGFSMSGSTKWFSSD